MELLLPAGGRGPGVVLGHAWWGLNPAIRAYGARLAAAGFVVGLPDLFEGQTATTIAAAEALVGRDWDADGKLAAAEMELSRHPAVTGERMAAVGFSYGGFALIGLTESETLQLAGAVVYYASRVPEAPHAPILAHLAENDPFESAESMAAMAAALAAAGPPNAAYSYSGTTHWFAEEDRPEYAPAAADLALTRTVEFLRAVTGAA